MMVKSSTAETRTCNEAVYVYDDRAVLRPEGLTTRPHTDLY